LKLSVNRENTRSSGGCSVILSFYHLIEHLQMAIFLVFVIEYSTSYMPCAFSIEHMICYDKRSERIFFEGHFLLFRIESSSTSITAGSYCTFQGRTGIYRHKRPLPAEAVCNGWSLIEWIHEDVLRGHSKDRAYHRLFR
jgi:hypothetical protein